MSAAIRITGTLGCDAEARMGTGGDAWVILEIHQGANALAVQARRHMGTGNAAQIAAHSSARLLRKGTRVTVHAGKYGIEYSPMPHLALTQVEFVEYVPVVRVRHCGVLEVEE